MTHKLFTIAAYFGLLGGSAALGSFLLYAAGHYPKLAHNPYLLPTGATIAWLGLSFFILNKAHTPDSDDT